MSIRRGYAVPPWLHMSTHYLFLRLRSGFLGERLARRREGKGRDALVFPGDNGQHLRQARVHEDK